MGAGHTLATGHPLIYGLIFVGPVSSRIGAFPLYSSTPVTTRLVRNLLKWLIPLKRGFFQTTGGAVRAHICSQGQQHRYQPSVPSLMTTSS